MPDQPLSLRILQALKARLQGISVANGYHTDAGDDVRIGRLRADGNTLHVALFSGSSAEAEDQGRNRITAKMTVEVAALVPSLPSDTDAEQAELVLADIQTAIEVQDGRAIGGLASDLTPLGRGKPVRPDGTVNEFVWMNYLVTYIRGYGRPDTKKT